ncbi:SDR family NAD(P)-dependent oxidoreductase [Nocardiopsis mangrovi]|uniref:SDR family NAD(P)-dependent oxidoreductase n=1 Tax=Nocardiopsis mangrovi TaxID=1179818 RepID=A0ABV9E6N5_9ACTN
MGALDGRVAVITGAGRGIGRAEALFFAEHGAKVVVNDPGVAADGSAGDTGVAQRVADEITALGGRAVATSDSVAEWDGARRVVATAVEAFGDLDVLVNNAAIERNRAVSVMTEEDFDAVVAVKLKGTFATTRWAVRHWRSRAEAGELRDRSVVNTASGSGLLNPLPAQTNYAAVNAGIAAMTTVHALELGRYRVRVNCVSPSMVRTRLSEAVPGMPGPAPAGAYDPAHPVAVAPVAAYLASAACTLNGQVVSVRGGSVAINRGWTTGPRVDAGARYWTVPELAAELESLPHGDPVAELTAALRGALGAGGEAAIRHMIDTALDAPDPAPPVGA